MNKKEITKKLIRRETCDTCRWKDEKGCFFDDDITPDTKQIEYKALPKENTCGDWATSFDGTYTNEPSALTAQTLQDAMDAMQKTVGESMSVPKELLGDKSSHISEMLKLLRGWVGK